MQHTYYITGMTCDSCKEKVSQALLPLESICQVDIDREKGSAQITMDEHVPTIIMQNALSKIGSYSITMDHAAVMNSEKKTTLRDVAPLLGIFTFVIALTLILNYLVFTPSPMLGMRLFMGIFFVVFGGFKVVNIKAFAEAYSTYDLIAMRSKVYSYTYPFIELVLGVLFLTGIGLLCVNIISLILMSIGVYGIYLKLMKKEKIICACLGVVFKVPMTWVTLVEDLVMVVMAGIMIVLLV